MWVYRRLVGLHEIRRCVALLTSGVLHTVGHLTYGECACPAAQMGPFPVLRALAAISLWGPAPGEAACRPAESGPTGSCRLAAVTARISAPPHPRAPARGFLGPAWIA